MQTQNAAPAARQIISRSYAIWLGVVTLLLAWPLYRVLAFGLSEDLHSHIVLVPVVCGYLILIERSRLPQPGRAAILPGAVLAVLAALAFGLSVVFRSRIESGDVHSLAAVAYVLLVWAGAFLCMGGQWVRAAIFPLAFLVFFIPMPHGMEIWLENASKAASADVSALFFQLAGTPNLRSGQVFELPGITIEVAQECSGIRSSWVLFITGILASYLFLRTPWRRAVLVLFVIPLGVARNAFRILAIGWLCVEVGPEMINHFIHRKGGPVFFVLSLIPLTAFAILLRWSESRSLERTKDVVERGNEKP